MHVVDEAAIERAVAALARGGLVGLPTETVYGLAADAESPVAVRRIFAAKGRPAEHPLIVHVLAGDLDRYARDVPAGARRLCERFWPGPLTLILERAARVPDAVTGGLDTVGLRSPDHPVAQALLAKFGRGVAAPSANRFGRISPTRAEHVREELGDAVDVVLDGGPSRVGVESTIVSFASERPLLLRPGAIGRDALSHALGEEVGLPRAGEATPRAPGTLASHYAPRTPLELVEPGALVERCRSLDTNGRSVAVYARRAAEAGAANATWVRAPDDAATFAHDLYAALRALDDRGVDRIVVEAVPDDEAWLAVADRLRRAAHHDA